MIELKHFSPETDPGIDFSHATPESLQMLDVARDIAGVPFKVSRSYSTPEHSIAVGGLGDDAHTEEGCTAYDVEYADHAQRVRIIFGLIKAGFTGIGVNEKNSHVHGDASPILPRPAFWIE